MGQKNCKTVKQTHKLVWDAKVLSTCQLNKLKKEIFFFRNQHQKKSFHWHAVLKLIAVYLWSRLKAFWSCMSRVRGGNLLHEKDIKGLLSANNATAQLAFCNLLQCEHFATVLQCFGRVNVIVAQFVQCFPRVGWVWGRGPLGGSSFQLVLLARNTSTYTLPPTYNTLQCLQYCSQYLRYCHQYLQCCHCYCYHIKYCSVCNTVANNTKCCIEALFYQYHGGNQLKLRIIALLYQFEASFLFVFNFTFS